MQPQPHSDRCEQLTTASGGKARCRRRATYTMTLDGRDREVCQQHAEDLVFHYGATVKVAPGDA